MADQSMSLPQQKQKQKQKPIYLAVIGVGGVGTSFLNQLHSVIGSAESSEAANSSLSRVQLVYVARSSKAVLSRDGQAISTADWAARLDASTDAPLSTAGGSNSELIDFLKSYRPAVLVDNTSNQDIADAYPSLLQAGISVVTPSKLAFAGDWSLWQQIYASASNGSGPPGNGLVFHEAVVGAGLPIVGTIKDLVATGNAPTHIEGVFSGTLSFLFNSLMPARPLADRRPSFSALVRHARQLGYTEPDPRSDLSGLDVARKCTILARLCGVAVAGPHAVRVQSLVPPELQHCRSGDEFVDRLAEFDSRIDSLMEKATTEDKVLRYVGIVDVQSGACEVKLQSFKMQHPLAGVTDDTLQLNIHTRHYGERPIVIQGSGEGAYLGVMTDLVRVCEALK